jgi:predicted ArsR family transcriptional regulator
MAYFTTGRVTGRPPMFVGLGDTADDTRRAQHLHVLAAALAQAKAANDAAKVATLLDQFQTAAAEYEQLGGQTDAAANAGVIASTETWLADAAQRAQDLAAAAGRVATGVTTSAAQAAGSALGDIVKPLLIPGLIAVAVLYFWSRRR